LEARDVWFGYAAEQPVLRGVSLEIARGEFVALAGQNGSGKTTLAKHFNGLLRANRGAVLLDGEDICGRSTGELARTVGYAFQNPDHQIFSATVFDEVAFGPRNLGFDAARVEQAVADALARFGLETLARHSPATLAFGLRRLVTLAAVLAMQTPMLVLDEPTAGLDRAGTMTVMATLTALHRQGRTIVLITHDMRVVADFVPRVVVLRGGDAAAEGSARALFGAAERLADTGLEPPQITRLAQRLRGRGMRGDILTVDEFCDEYGVVTGKGEEERVGRG
jgi:energy-coupling factor transport system ATP-binding protein